MKTLEKVLQRDDYQRLLSSLNEKVEEIAEKIMQKMKQLDLRSLQGF